MKRLIGIKALILIAGIQLLGGLGFHLAPMPEAAAQSCVNVPSLKDLGARTNAALTNRKILDKLRHQGPSGEFPKGIKVYYLGSARTNAKKYHVVYTVLVWDNGVRETDRLVFFSRDWHYLGDYGEIYDPPKKICGNVLYWSYDPKIGNKIVLDKNGPPKTVVLDGEVYGFDDSKAGQQ